MSGVQVPFCSLFLDRATWVREYKVPRKDPVPRPKIQHNRVSPAIPEPFQFDANTTQDDVEATRMGPSRLFVDSNGRIHVPTSNLRGYRACTHYYVKDRTCEGLQDQQVQSWSCTQPQPVCPGVERALRLGDLGGFCQSKTPSPISPSVGFEAAVDDGDTSLMFVNCDLVVW